MLAKVITVDLSLELDEGNSLASKVCWPCGTKVRNCASLLHQIKENINKPNLTIATSQEATTVEDEGIKQMGKSPHSSQNKNSACVSICIEPAPSFSDLQPF